MRNDRVGIGTTSPDNILHIIGSLDTSTIGTNALAVLQNDRDSTGASAADLEFRTDVKKTSESNLKSVASKVTSILYRVGISSIATSSIYYSDDYPPVVMGVIAIASVVSSFVFDSNLPFVSKFLNVIAINIDKSKNDPRS